MANYSADSDLSTFFQDVSNVLPGTATLALYHAEAKREIERRLRGRGFNVTTDLPYLSAASLADLKAASCLYVLHLAFSGNPSMDTDMAARAEAFWARFDAMMNSLNIELDTNADTYPEATTDSSGECYLV